MPFDPSHWRAKATTLVVVAGLLLMGLGVLAFVVALRPCRLELEPGRTLTWELTTTITELTADGRDGRMREDRRLLHLVCTGPGNQAALVVSADGARDIVEPVVLSPDGTTRRIDPQGRPVETGVAVGWFDLSLLPLPPDSGHRPWEVTVPYALLPLERAQVQARARRQRAGSSPEFQLKFPESVQWIDNGRYRQLRDLVCSYRFAGDHGVVDRADLTLITRSEAERGVSQARINAALRLIDTGSSDDDAEHLRQAAAAGRDALAALATNDRARALVVVERTPAVSYRPLRDALQRIAQSARGRDGGERRAVLRAAVYPRRDQAERLARALIAAGLPARLRTTPGAVEVLVGPYPARDPGAMAAVARITRSTPAWVEVP